MLLRSSDNLKFKISQENPDHKRRMESFKSSLKLAYQAVAKANRTSHRNEKILYDRKAKSRYFQVGDLVYLHNPSVKKGLSKKFSKPWTGIFQVTKRHSELNYEIMEQIGKKQVFHINRLKKAYNADLWKPKTKKTVKNKPKTRTQCTEDEEEAELPIRSFPLSDASRVASNREHYAPPDQFQADTSTAELSPGSQSLYQEIQVTTPQRHQNHNANSIHLQSLVLEPEYCHRKIQGSYLYLNMMYLLAKFLEASNML